MTEDVWMTSGEWLPVTSTNVKEIRYNFALKRLFVRFKGSSRGILRPIYDYTPVPIIVARRMFRSASKGSYVWEHLRDGGYTVNGPYAG